jgi:Domain of unknown function (DUF3459)
MLAWYRALIAARRGHPELHASSPSSTIVEQTGDVLRIDRGPFALVVNFADLPARTTLGDVVLASHALSSANELPPVACALVRS